MKNIRVLSTDKPSRLHESGLFSSLGLSKEYLQWKFGKNIYITSNEEIKDKCYVLSQISIGALYLDGVINTASMLAEGQWKKIILTTDQDLIKDGVQAIDDDFLEWFVNNPTCESVEVKPMLSNNGRALFGYKIIIPKEEPKQDKIMERFIANAKPKQETLEEAAEKYAISKDSSSIFIKVHKKDFINGGKWQQEISYSDEDMIAFGEFIFKHSLLSHSKGVKNLFEQFKKK